MAGWTPLLGSGPRDFDEHRPGDFGSPIDTGYKSYPEDIPLVDASPRTDSQLSSPTFQRDSFKGNQRRSTKTSSIFYAEDRANNKPYIYDYHKTRTKIFLIGFGEWLLTVTLCGATIGCLKLYEGVQQPRLLSTRDTRWFNAYMVAISLALSFNLASSLKSYASMLRWVLLTKQWYTLEIFDLILACTGQTKLIELAIKTCPWPRFKILGKNPSKRICTMAILWILVNLGAQVAVASLSLFWPTEPSPKGVLLSRGNVSVTNFETWFGGNLEPGDDFMWRQRSASGAVNRWGLQGQDFTELPYVSFDNETEGRQTVYWKPGEFWEYRFEDRNAADGTSRWSNRYIRTSAKCETFPVPYHNIGHCTWPDDEVPVSNSSMNEPKDLNVDCYKFYKDGTEYSHVIPHHVGSFGGSTVYRAEAVSLGNESRYPAVCGPRCNHVQVFQSSGGENFLHDTYMECNSTMSEIMEHDSTNTDFINLSEENRSRIFMNDSNARLGAGSIGLQEMFHFFVEWTTVGYDSSLPWNPNVTITVEIMEKLISRFAIGAVAAFADQGHRLVLTDQTNVPTQAQVLEVNWKWIYILVGSICGVQLVSLILLMAFGNKAIVRDDGAWSLARLLLPVVSKLKEGSSIMPNKDISDAPVFKGQRIAYGERPGAESNTVDILWEGRDQLRRTSFQPGLY